MSSGGLEGARTSLKVIDGFSLKTVEGGILSTETGMTFRTAKSQSLDSIFSSHQVITLLDNAEANEGFAPRAFPRFYQL